MKATHRRVLLSVLLPALILSTTSFRLGDRESGWRDAAWDVLRGNYRVKIYGLPDLCTPEYAKLLRDRYNIKYEVVAGCVVFESQANYWDSYNMISKAAIARKFHAGVLEECWRDGAKLCASKLTAGKPSPEEAQKNNK